MEIMKLSDIATISAGQSAPQGDECYTNDGIPFVKAGNLSELIEHNDENQIQKVSEKTISDYKLKLYPKGTILFAKSGMSCMKGLVYVLKQDCYVVSHLACITPLNIESDYLKYYFEYHKPNTLVKDESYPSISLKDIGDMTIKVFNAEKRKEIIENLNKLNILINKNKSLLKKYDELVKSQFIEMFENYFNNKINERKLIQVVDFIDYRGKTPEKSDYGIKLITAKNVKMHKFSEDPKEFIPEENYQNIMTRGFPNVDDVLFTTEAPLGNVCRIPMNLDKFCVGQRIVVLQPKKKITNSVYVEFTLTSKDFREEMFKKSSGSTVKGIKSKLLKELNIPIPPIELQNQFADFVKHIDKLKFTIKQSIEKLNLCYQSLMKEYFE